MKANQLRVSASCGACILFLWICPIPALAVFIELGTSSATSSHSQNDWVGPFDVHQAVDGITTSTSFPEHNGWAINPYAGQEQSALFETVTDANFHAAGGYAHFALIQDFIHGLGGFVGQDFHQIGRFQFSFTSADRTQFADGLSTGGNLGPDSIWTVLDPSSYAAFYRDGTPNIGTTLTKQTDNSILAAGDNSRGYYTINAPLDEIAVTGFRIDLLPDPSLPYGGPGREPSNGNFVLTEFLVSTSPFDTLYLGERDPDIVPVEPPVVPEPSTYIAGALMLLPFGVQGIRLLRKRKS